MKIVCLILSCDANAWVWPYWWAYFKQNWTFIPEIEVVFLYETLRPDYPGITYFKTGKCMWSNALIKYLDSNKDVQYFIYTAEDNFLFRPAKTRTIITACNVMQQCDSYVTKIYRNKFVWEDLAQREKEFVFCVPIDKKLKRENPNGLELHRKEAELLQRENKIIITDLMNHSKKFLVIGIDAAIWNAKFYRSILSNNITSETAERQWITKMRTIKNIIGKVLYCDRETYTYINLVRRHKIDETYREIFDKVDRKEEPYRFDLPKFKMK